MTTPTTPAAHSQLTRTWADAPTPLRWLAWCLGLSMVALIALPLVMTLDRAGVEATIRDADPTLTPDDVEFGYLATLIYSYVLHLVGIAVLAWLGWKVLIGRRWARIALTAFLIFLIGAALFSAGAGTMYLWAVIIGYIAHFAVLGLLWVPGSVRSFFGNAEGVHRSGHRSRTKAAASAD